MAEIFSVLGLLSLFGMIGALSSERAFAAGVFLASMTLFFGAAVIIEHLPRTGIILL